MHRQYLYFIQDRDSGLIKIGESDNPDVRLSQLKGKQHGHNLIILCAVPQYVPMEKVLHWKFVNSRYNGEWFYPTNDLLTYIEEIRKHTKGNNFLEDSLTYKNIVEDALSLLKDCETLLDKKDEEIAELRRFVRIVGGFILVYVVVALVAGIKIILSMY